MFPKQFIFREFARLKSLITSDGLVRKYIGCLPDIEPQIFDFLDIVFGNIYSQNQATTMPLNFNRFFKQQKKKSVLNENEKGNYYIHELFQSFNVNFVTFGKSIQKIIIILCNVSPSHFSNK